LTHVNANWRTIGRDLSRNNFNSYEAISGAAAAMVTLESAVKVKA